MIERIEKGEMTYTQAQKIMAYNKGASFWSGLGNLARLEQTKLIIYVKSKETPKKTIKMLEKELK